MFCGVGTYYRNLEAPKRLVIMSFVQGLALLLWPVFFLQQLDVTWQHLPGILKTPPGELQTDTSPFSA